MLLLDKLSEQQQEEEEMLHLCLTGFYLPVEKGQSIAFYFEAVSLCMGNDVLSTYCQWPHKK